MNPQNLKISQIINRRNLKKNLIHKKNNTNNFGLVFNPYKGNAIRVSVIVR